jgi:hypothetical protein
MVDDARALWVNPGGLGIQPSASIMGELAVERATTGDLRLGQWTVAFNSRGLSLGYQRDRFPTTPTTGETFRFGTAVPLGRGSLGGSISLYRGGVEGNEMGGDIGITYRLSAPFTVGAVVRNIGRPVVRTAPAPLEGTLGGAWLATPGVLELAADVTVREGLGTASTEASYRGGIHFSPGLRVPFGIVSALELDKGLSVINWLVGVSFGRTERGIGLLSGGNSGGTQAIERFSLTGVAAHGALRAHP